MKRFYFSELRFAVENKKSAEFNVAVDDNKLTIAFDMAGEKRAVDSLVEEA